jgi:hypothetical protein
MNPTNPDLNLSEEDHGRKLANQEGLAHETTEARAMICHVAFHDAIPEPITSARAESFRAWIKAMPGFIAGWHAADPTTGRMVSFSVWESEEHLRVLRDKVPLGGRIGLKHTQRETFSVVVQF